MIHGKSYDQASTMHVDYQPQTNIVTNQALVPYITQEQVTQPETRKAQRINIAAAILTVINAVILLVGISTSYWTTFSDVSWGLWQYCYYKYRYGHRKQSEARFDWDVVPNVDHDLQCHFTLAGAIMIPALILYSIGIILTFTVTFARVKNKRNIVIITSLMHCITLVLVICALGAAWSMGEQYESQYIVDSGGFSQNIHVRVSLSWSFGFTVLFPFGLLILISLTGISAAEYTRRSRRRNIGERTYPACRYIEERTYPGTPCSPRNHAENCTNSGTPKSIHQYLQYPASGAVPSTYPYTCQSTYPERLHVTFSK